MAMQIEVTAGSELDAALAKAEMAGESVELVHGGRRYRIVPAGKVLTPADLARRREIGRRALAARAKQKPLGITTAELIREARAERYGE